MFGAARAAVNGPERELSLLRAKVRRVLWREVGNEYIRSDAYLLTEKDALLQVF